MELIPIQNIHNQTFTIILGPHQVNARLWYQPLTSVWCLTVSIGTQRIMTGRQIAVDTRLVRSPDFIGELLCIRLEGNSDPDMGPLPWGSTHALVYLTEAETADYPWTRP